jgi:hypothetical protein
MSMWLACWCDAHVSWDTAGDGSDGASSRRLREGRGFVSTSRLSGSVRVDEVREWVGQSYRRPWLGVVPRTRSLQAIGKGPVVLLMLGWLVVFVGVGALAARPLPRRLPDPPEKKDWRGVNRRRHPGFNGPRRRGRGRR